TNLTQRLNQCPANRRRQSRCNPSNSSQSPNQFRSEACCSLSEATSNWFLGKVPKFTFATLAESIRSPFLRPISNEIPATPVISNLLLIQICLCWLLIDHRRFEFQKRSQFFIGSHTVTLSVVAVCVCNPDRFYSRVTQIALESFLIAG